MFVSSFFWPCPSTWTSGKWPMKSHGLKFGTWRESPWSLHARKRQLREFKVRNDSPDNLVGVSQVVSLNLLLWFTYIDSHLLIYLPLFTLSSRLMCHSRHLKKVISKLLARLLPAIKPPTVATRSNMWRSKDTIQSRCWKRRLGFCSSFPGRTATKSSKSGMSRYVLYFWKVFWPVACYMFLQLLRNTAIR